MCLRFKNHFFLAENIDEHERTDARFKGVCMKSECVYLRVCCGCVGGSRFFWDVVLAFPLELQKKLLHFTTGSDRVPVGGTSNLSFRISRMDVQTDW